jgi:hypothetical protein
VLGGNANAIYPQPQTLQKVLGGIAKALNPETKTLQQVLGGNAKARAVLLRNAERFGVRERVLN